MPPATPKGLWRGLLRRGAIDATQITAGAGDTCALLAGGHVDCWGGNYDGQLGDGTDTGPEACREEAPCSKVPVTINGLSDVTQVSGSSRQICALLADGGITCWGGNETGALGIGLATGPETCYSLYCSTTPRPVVSITTAKQMSMGDALGCAVLSDGGIECWGYGAEGGLGDGSTTNSDVPVPVAGFGPPL